MVVLCIVEFTIEAECEVDPIRSALGRRAGPGETPIASIDVAIGLACSDLPYRMGGDEFGNRRSGHDQAAGTDVLLECELSAIRIRSGRVRTHVQMRRTHTWGIVCRHFICMSQSCGSR